MGASSLCNACGERERELRVFPSLSMNLRMDPGQDGGKNRRGRMKTWRSRQLEGKRERGRAREGMDASRPQSVKPVRGLQLWRVWGRSQRRHTRTVERREEEKQRERKEQFVLRVLEYRGGPATTCGAKGPQIDGGKKSNQQLKITRFKWHFFP